MNCNYSKKGSRSVQDYSCQFKSVCDQLAAIGRPIDDTDKLHWFLRGLGSTFSSFSASQYTRSPLLSFEDLLNNAESYAICQESIESTGPTAAAFAVQRVPSPSHVSVPCPPQHAPKATGRGSGKTSSRRPPHCQICRTDGHYASTYKDRYTTLNVDGSLQPSDRTTTHLA